MRLYELWLERSFGDWGSIRFGQLAADGEFATPMAPAPWSTAPSAGPAALAGTLPAGGPAYPLASPGVRLAWASRMPARACAWPCSPAIPAAATAWTPTPQLAQPLRHQFQHQPAALFFIGEVVTGGASPNRDERRALGAQARRLVPQWRLQFGRAPTIPGCRWPTRHRTGVPRRYGSNYGGYAIGEVDALARGGRLARALRPRLRAAAGPQRDQPAARWRPGLARPLRPRRRHRRRSACPGRGSATSRAATTATVDRLRRHPRPCAATRRLLELNYDVAVMPGPAVPCGPSCRRCSTRPPANRMRAAQPETALPNALLVGLRVVASF